MMMNMPSQDTSSEESPQYIGLCDDHLEESEYPKRIRKWFFLLRKTLKWKYLMKQFDGDEESVLEEIGCAKCAVKQNQKWVKAVRQAQVSRFSESPPLQSPFIFN